MSEYDLIVPSVSSFQHKLPTKASGGKGREQRRGVVDNGKEAVSNSVEELIDTVKTRIQTIRDNLELQK
jgi:hypothetical protein